MKNIIAYILLISVLLAYNYKTINYYIRLTDTSINFCQEYDCEEKNSEAKKSVEKNEKTDLSEYLPVHKGQAFLTENLLSFSQQCKTLYISSDYSMSVYSPPDAAIS